MTIVHVAGQHVLLRTDDGRWVTAVTASQPIPGWERHHEGVIDTYRTWNLVGEQIAVTPEGMPVWYLATTSGIAIDSLTVSSGTSLPRTGISTHGADLYATLSQAREENAGAWRYAQHAGVALLPEHQPVSTDAVQSNPVYTAILFTTGIIFLVAILLNQGRRAAASSASVTSDPGAVPAPATADPQPRPGLTRRALRGARWYASLWNPYRKP